MGKITINMDSLRSGRDYVRHKINDGSNIYRILPPFGDLSVHNNYPYRRWAVTWLVNPKSNKSTPYATPMMDGEVCPIQEYANALSAFIDKRKNQLTAEGYSDKEIKTELEGLRKIQWNIKVSYSYAYNACNKAGVVGLLELKTTAHKAMKKQMNLFINEHSQDPTSLGADSDEYGVWFNIVKEGDGKDTEYSVSFNQTKERKDGKLIKLDDTSPLPDNVIENYGDLAYDLNTIYTRKSYDELKSLLIYNLSLIADETPDAVLPGYEMNQSSKLVKVPTTAPTKPKTSKVALNLRDDDDEDEDEVPTKPVAKKAPVTSKHLSPVYDEVDDDDIPFGAAVTMTKDTGKSNKASMSRTVDDEELSRLTNEILGD